VLPILAVFQSQTREGRDNSPLRLGGVCINDTDKLQNSSIAGAAPRETLARRGTGAKMPEGLAALSSRRLRAFHK
jgi:hypothetical protein